MYKLINKYIGVNKISTFSEVNDSLQIKDICFVPELGYFFIGNQCIGKIDLNGKIEYPICGNEGVSGYKRGFANQTFFENPSSICYNDDEKTLLVVEKNGQKICSINTLDEYYSSFGISNVIEEKMKPMFLREPEQNNTSICYKDYSICWCISSLNRVFKVYDRKMLTVYGNGKKWYAVSNISEHNSFNSPSGILFENGTIYISDKENNCIRTIGENDNSIVCGHPINGNVKAGKLIFLKNSLYYIDSNAVYGLLQSQKKSYLVYEASKEENVISITGGANNKLSILVKTK